MRELKSYLLLIEGHEIRVGDILLNECCEPIGNVLSLSKFHNGTVVTFLQSRLNCDEQRKTSNTTIHAGDQILVNRLL